MKSNILLASGLILAAALSSCSLDDGVNEQTLSSQMNQLVIPDDASKEVTAQSNCLFVMKMDLNASTMDITATDVNVNGTKATLSMPGIKYAYAYSGVADSYYFKSADGMFGNSRVEGASGYLTSFIPGFRGKYALVMDYRVNGATVKTFSATPLFSGTTTTRYPMSPEPAVNTDATYGIIFADDMKTATVSINNIQFAPGAPKLEAVLLKDVAVSLDRDGYTLTTTDQIPEVTEGGVSTPYPNFPFASFTLHTTNDRLTEVSCQYQVDAVMGERSMTFYGEFTGKCADYIRTEQTEK